MEIELKLLVAPEHLARIERHPVLKDLRRPPRRKSISWRSITTRRISSSRARAWRYVCGKTACNGCRRSRRRRGCRRAACARRAGVGGCAGQALDLEALHDTPYRKLFDDAACASASGRCSRPSSTARRACFRSPMGRPRSLRSTAATSAPGAMRRAISEAEIELKTGDAIRLFEVARALAHDMPLRLGHASKAERGYALARRAVAPRKARSIPLDETLSTGRALRRIACGVHRADAGERGGHARRGRDPEYLHQLRVGLRRLRAALGFAYARRGQGSVAAARRRAALAAERARAGARLGRVREKRSRRSRARSREQRAWRVSARAARGARRAREAAREAVRSQRYTTLLISLGERSHARKSSGCAQPPPATRPSAEERDRDSMRRSASSPRSRWSGATGSSASAAALCCRRHPRRGTKSGSRRKSCATPRSFSARSIRTRKSSATSRRSSGCKTSWERRTTPRSSIACSTKRRQRGRRQSPPEWMAWCAAGSARSRCASSRSTSARGASFGEARPFWR